MNRDELIKILKECRDIKKLQEALHQKGWKLSDKTEEGETLVHIISEQFNDYLYINLIKSILNLKEIDINAFNAKGETCFDVLLQTGSFYRTEIGLLFLNAGLDCLQKNPHTNTPLHSVLNFAPIHWVQLATRIMSGKFNPSALNQDRKSCLDLLFAKQPLRWADTALELILMEIESKPESVPLWLMKLLNNYTYQSDKIIVTLLDRLRDFTYRNEQGKTYLDIALESQHIHEAIFLAICKKMTEHDQNLITLKSLIEASLSNKIKNWGFRIRLKKCFNHCQNLYEFDDLGRLWIAQILHVDNKRFHELSYELSDIIGHFFKDFKFELNRNISGKTALARLDIPNIQSKGLLNILSKYIFQYDISVIKEFIHICHQHKIFTREILMMHMAEQSCEIQDPSLLEIELQVISSRLYGEDYYSFDTKMLGHRFSLQGLVPTQSSSSPNTLKQSISLTGSFHLSCAFALSQSLQSFLENFYSEMDAATQKLYKNINHIARKALRYRFLLEDYRPDSNTQQPKILNALLNDCLRDVALIYTGYAQHAVCIVIAQGKTLYRCNKGGCNFGNDVIEEYKITKPQGLTVELLNTLITKDNKEENKLFIHKEIHEILGLELVSVIKGKLQTSGNCSWASKKTGVRALIHYYMNQKEYRSKDSEHKNKNENEMLAVTHQLFKAWTHFDRRYYLQQYIDRYAETSTLPYLLRRIICTHFEADKDKDLALGKRLIKHLQSLPNFKEGYVEFLIRDWQLKNRTSLTIIGKEKDKRHQFSEFMNTLGCPLVISDDFPVIVQLFSATLNNDLKRLNEILTSGIKADDCEYLGWTALHLAVASGNIETVDFLIRFETKWASTKNYLQRSPLFYVKNPEIAERLLKYNKEVNEEADYDDSPLNTAASQGNLALVQCFIQHGAKPNRETLHCASRSGCVKTGSYLLEIDPSLITQQDYDYYLPIHTAAELGHSAFVTLLLQHGSKVSNPDVNGNTPLHLAARYEKDDVIQCLAKLPTCNLRAKNSQQRTLLSLSPDKGDRKWHQEISRSMQECDKAESHYDVFVQNKRLSLLKTPEQTLFGAVRTGDMIAVKGCLAKFPNLDINAIPEPFSNTVLQEAISHHHHDIFDLLMKIPNIDVNVNVGLDETSLHKAIAANNLYALKILIVHPKILVNAPEAMGYTPLHDAAERGHIEAVKILLAHPDIDSTLLCKKGQTADEVSLLSFNRNKEIVSLIQGHQRSLQQKTRQKL